MLCGIGTTKFFAVSTKAVKTKDDLKGLKYRTSGALAEILKDVYGAAPVVMAGVDPVWFAVLMICVIQTSYLTPPMTPEILYFRTIALLEITYRHMYRGVTAFVALELIVLAVMWFLTWTATWLPNTVTQFRELSPRQILAPCRRRVRARRGWRRPG